MPEPAPAAAPEAGSPVARRPRLAVVTAVLAAAWFLVGANIAVVPPLLPFMSTELGLTGWQRGAVVAALPLASFAGNLLFGPLVDVIGRRRSVLAGSAGAALLLAASAAVGDGGAAVVLRAATGVLMPLVGIAVFPSLADYVEREHRMTMTGRVTAGGSLAQLVTVPAAIYLAAHASWRWSFAALAVVAAAVCAATLFLLPPVPRSRPAGPRRLFRPLLLPAAPSARSCVLSFWLFTLALFTVTSFYPTWVLRDPAGAERSADAVSMLFAAGGVLAVLGAALTGSVARLRSRWLVLLLASPAPLALALAATAPLLAAQGALYGLLMFAQATAFPLLRGRSNALAGEGELATTNASLNAGYQVAAAVAASVAAALIGWAPSFWLNAGVAAILFLLCAAVFARGVTHRVTDAAS